MTRAEFALVKFGGVPSPLPNIYLVIYRYTEQLNLGEYLIGEGLDPNMLNHAKA